MTSDEAGFFIASVKWRNQLLALSCLFVFLAFGVFYFQYWVVQKPFGIIIFVAEGLDARSLAAARLHKGGADKTLAIDSLPYTALLKNYSENSSTPDLAAAATALATGVRVNNGAIAVDPEGNSLQTLLELAHEGGRMTGLVTDGSLTSATAASFYAHFAKKPDDETIAAQLAATGNLDVVLGGGSSHFSLTSDGGRRTDERDLLGELRDGGYELIQTLEDLEAVPRWRRAKLFGFFAQDELTFAEEVESPGDQPSLADLVRHAIELLQFNRGGYVLVVDASLMRKASENQQSDRAASETIELDRAVAVAVDYAGPKSAVLVCSDVARRSDSMIQAAPEGGESQAAQFGEEQLAPTKPPYARPEQTPTDTDIPASEGENHESELATEPEHHDTGNATAADVLAFGTGLGANALHGVAESTVIFDIVRDNL